MHGNDYSIIDKDLAIRWQSYRKIFIQNSILSVNLVQAGDKYL